MNYQSLGKKLSIEYNPEYSIVFTSETDDWFQQQWDTQSAIAKKKKSLLFNGPLFHVAGTKEIGDEIFLKLGNTDYKSYVGSRNNEFRMKFPQLSFSKPLAACIAIITSDNKLLIERRKGVDTHEGMFHVVGGYVDPFKDMDEKGNPDIYQSIQRETKEETGLTIERNRLIFIGLAEDSITPHYELCFCSSLPITSDEVVSIINSSNTDGEFNHPIFIDFSESGVSKFLETNKNSISPTGKACIEMSVSLILK